MLTAIHFFQALRRSIKGEKDSAKGSVNNKSAVAIVPPKKVRALPASGPCSLTFAYKP